MGRKGRGRGGQNIQHNIDLDRCYGPNFRRKIKLSRVKNIITGDYEKGKLTGKNHHCPICKKAVKIRCCKNGHIAWCLAIVTVNGRESFCGHRFHPKSSTGCSLHKYANGHNLFWRDAMKGKDHEGPPRIPHEEPGYEWGLGAMIEEDHEDEENEDASDDKFEVELMDDDEDDDDDKENAQKSSGKEKALDRRGKKRSSATPAPKIGDYKSKVTIAENDLRPWEMFNKARDEEVEQKRIVEKKRIEENKPPASEPSKMKQKKCAITTKTLVKGRATQDTVQRMTRTGKSSVLLNDRNIINHTAINATLPAALCPRPQSPALNGSTNAAPVKPQVPPTPSNMPASNNLTAERGQALPAAASGAPNVLVSSPSDHEMLPPGRGLPSTTVPGHTIGPVLTLRIVFPPPGNTGQVLQDITMQANRKNR